MSQQLCLTFFSNLLQLFAASKSVLMSVITSCMLCSSGKTVYVSDVHGFIARCYAYRGLSHRKSVCPSVTLVDCAHLLSYGKYSVGDLGNTSRSLDCFTSIFVKRCVTRHKLRQSTNSISYTSVWSVPRSMTLKDIWRSRQSRLLSYSQTAQTAILQQCSYLVSQISWYIDFQ